MDLSLLSTRSPIEAIHDVLHLEYGTDIPATIKNAKRAKVITVKREQLFVPNRSYLNKIETFSKYVDIEQPIGVYLKDGDKYRLVDGYHRYLATKDRNKVDIVALS